MNVDEINSALSKSSPGQRVTRSRVPFARPQARVGPTVGGRAEDGRRVAQRQDPLPENGFSTEQINSLSNRVIGYAITVHKTLGPGFIEKLYARALAHEFQKHNVEFVRGHSFRVMYEGEVIGEQRLDFLIEDEIVLEAKAMYEIANFHVAQVLSYLKAAKKRLGLICNFSRPRLQIKRLVWNL